MNVRGNMIWKFFFYFLLLLSLKELSSNISVLDDERARSIYIPIPSVPLLLAFCQPLLELDQRLVPVRNPVLERDGAKGR